MNALYGYGCPCVNFQSVRFFMFSALLASQNNDFKKSLIKYLFL
jgi:hypothetical protein